MLPATILVHLTHRWRYGNVKIHIWTRCTYVDIWPGAQILNVKASQNDMISGRWAVQIQVIFTEKFRFPSSCRNLCASKQGVEYAELWLKPCPQAHTESKIILCHTFPISSNIHQKTTTSAIVSPHTHRHNPMWIHIAAPLISSPHTASFVRFCKKNF